MTRVLVPVYGGLLSAYGMLAAPPRYAFSHAVLRTYDHDGTGYPDPLRDDAVLRTIESLVASADRALGADQVVAKGRTVNTALDLRFAGQSYEITVPCDGDTPVIDRFLDEHVQLYGYAPHGKPIELVAARLEALGPTPRITPMKPTVLDGPCRELDKGPGSRYRQRDSLAPGTVIHGPAILEEYAATTVVPRGWSALMLEDGQVLLQYKGGDDA